MPAAVFVRLRALPRISVPEIEAEVAGLRDLHNLREYLFG
jgi:hypothetical protein